MEENSLFAILDLNLLLLIRKKLRGDPRYKNPLADTVPPIQSQTPWISAMMMRSLSCSI